MILRRLEGQRFSEVMREWEGEAAAILAGGPSLTAEHAQRVKAAGLRTIAVNDSYLLAPFADVCYFADSQWWSWHAKREQFLSFQGQKCSIERSGSNIKDDEVHVLRNKTLLDPRAVVPGKNSGFQSMNLAILAGAKTILLLGFDGKSGPNGETHWHGGHPKPSPVDMVYEQMRRAFAEAENAIKAAGIRVVNCNPNSALDHFPKMTLDEALG